MLARPFLFLRHQCSRICSDSHMDFQGPRALWLGMGRFCGLAIVVSEHARGEALLGIGVGWRVERLRIKTNGSGVRRVRRMA